MAQKITKMKVKHTIAISIIYFILVNNAFCQKQIKQAPLNPDYLDFIKEYSSGMTDAEEMMAAPSPYQLNFKQYFEQKKLLNPKSYPIAYDMRIAGPGGTSLLTPVKHQLSCGACWAFATYGSIESTWKMIDFNNLDLSENNLKNCHGFDLDPCQWGHHFMSTAYLVRGSGPINELDDPYDPNSTLCTQELSPAAYVPRARYLPEDHDAFKETIMNVGAVYNTYRSVSGGYDWIYDHFTYCYQGPGTTSHAIAIVGWNDTLTTACGQGAWLCKNEYGTSFGEDGFFYISYQDTLVLKYNAVWPEKEEFDPQLNIYQYDTIGGWPFIGYENPIAYGLIKYVAANDLFITRIGTYTVSYGSYLSAEIYDDFDGTNLTTLMATIPEQFCDYPGFWQLELPDNLSINSGEDFYIKVKYNAPGEDYPLAIEGSENGYTNPSFETGKCWTSPDQTLWEAAGNGTPNQFDLCIKVYTYDITEVDLNVLLEGPFDEMNMKTDLNPLLPLSQPYNINPWNYEGTESVSMIPNNDIVDWILVELRETEGSAELAADSTRIALKAGFINKYGKVVGLDGISHLEFKLTIHKNLYAIIHHRNHLLVMSSIPLTDAGGLYQYNFTDAIDKAYNSCQKHLGNGKYGMIGGDGSSDGTVDSSDKINIWELQAGEEGYKEGDFNMNSQINDPDKNDIWEPNQGSSSQIPQ